MDLSYLRTSSYWFTSSPDYQSRLYVPLMIVFGLMLILGIAIIYFAKGELRAVWKRYVKPLIITSILGFIYLLARYEQLPYLAARAVLALIVLVFLLWLSYLFLWSAKHIPVIVKENDKEEKFNKYLPRQVKSQKLNLPRR